MQYHCVQCNEVFTADPSEDRPRCPKCLRQHGLRPIEASAPVARTKRSWLPLAVVALLLAAGGGFAFYHFKLRHVPGQVALAPEDPDDLRDDVRVIAGIDVDGLARMLSADAQVRAFAERAAKGKATPSARAEAICAALADRKRKQAFVDWPRDVARDTPPLTASGTLTAIARDGAHQKLYPIELSALAVAALRSLGVPAMIAEVYSYPNERSPLDGSGRFGYYGVLLPKTATQAERVFDAYANRSGAPAAGEYAIRNDAQAVAALLAQRAVQRFENHSDAKGGLADSQAAVKLAPSSASVRSARASLLLATGGIEAGTHELESAVQLRGDAPRHNNLAVLELLSGDSNQATKEVESALAERPDYAAARVTLATIHLMRNEPDQARSELETAQRLEPDLALLPQIWAQFYASTGDMERAGAQAQEAVQRRPRDPQARMILARIDRARGRYDDMRKQAREIMGLVPAEQQEQTRTALRAMLGPTAFADDDSAEPDAKPSTSPSSGGSDTLSLSGSAKADDHGPHLLDPTAASPGSGDLQLQPGTPKLQLGGGNGQLKLNLQP